MLKQLARKVSVLSAIALIAGSFAATGSFADWHHPAPVYHPAPVHHPVPGHGHYDGGYHDGFGDGLLAAFASVYSTLLSSETNTYEADTLIQSAAIYEADGIETPVFNSFVGAMSLELADRLGADQMSKLDAETLRHMVAEQILKDAQ